MREMILNHASVKLTKLHRGQVTPWLKDIVLGMSQLVEARVVQKGLRMSQETYATVCFDDYTLGHAIDDLRKAGFKEEYVFLSRLATKTPLLADTSEVTKNRFLSCETQMLPGIDGWPLLLCAITDSVALSFPSRSIWEKEKIEIEFQELLSDESYEQRFEEIEQLSRSSHAQPICDRHLANIQTGCRNPAQLWEFRKRSFPYLCFGRDVEANLWTCAQELHTIVGKLIALNEASKEWTERGGSAPRWRSKVTPESKEKMKDAKFVKTRTFRSSTGESRVFEWHARFGNSGRIHLRFDSLNRKVEIGYIGPHLPL